MLIIEIIIDITNTAGRRIDSNEIFCISTILFFLACSQINASDDPAIVSKHRNQCLIMNCQFTNAILMPQID
jgi:hypothetical protein